MPGKKVVSRFPSPEKSAKIAELLKMLRLGSYNDVIAEEITLPPKIFTLQDGVKICIN